MYFFTTVSSLNDLMCYTTKKQIASKTFCRLDKILIFSIKVLNWADAFIVILCDGKTA